MTLKFQGWLWTDMTGHKITTQTNKTRYPAEYKKVSRIMAVGWLAVDLHKALSSCSYKE